MPNEPKNQVRKGKWIVNHSNNVVCSECQGIRRDNRYDHINFCNRCGADMRVKNELRRVTMTDKECVEHMQRLKMGINILNSFIPDADKDNIDIEAIDYAIARLQENNE